MIIGVTYHFGGFCSKGAVRIQRLRMGGYTLANGDLTEDVDL